MVINMKIINSKSHIFSNYEISLIEQSLETIDMLPTKRLLTYFKKTQEKEILVCLRVLW